jgi:hypothetical protein
MILRSNRYCLHDFVVANQVVITNILAGSTLHTITLRFKTQISPEVGKNRLNIINL